MAAQPYPAEGVLYEDDTHARERAVDHVHVAVKPHAPVVEERRSEQRLQQVVGQAHAAEEGHAVQRPPESRPAVP